MIVRTTDPLNVESSFSELSSGLTPNEKFFVRNHFPVPEFDATTWRLKIEGAVTRGLELSLDDVRSYPAITLNAVIECAGNSRKFLGLKTERLPWELGAVGCAQWTGARLVDVLDGAGIVSSAVEIVFEGADVGAPEKATGPNNQIHFARSMPIEAARRPDVMLAYEMNGEPLPPNHGAPLRLIVPGWYGMASVKWLSRIVAVTKPFAGYYQSVDYTYWSDADGNGPELVPITENAIKSEIARPAAAEQITANAPYEISGAAWTSGAEIEKVDVSTDGGATWERATLRDAYQRGGWRLWEFLWAAPPVGAHRVMSRATDARGRVQPSAHDANSGNYVIHHTLPVDVTAK